MIVCSVVDQNPNEIHIQDTGFTKEVFYLNYCTMGLFWRKSSCKKSEIVFSKNLLYER